MFFLPAIMGAISAGTAALTGTLMTGAWMGALSGTFMGHFLVSTAMGAALNALTPKPKISVAGSQGYSIQGQTGAALDHQIIYGKTRVGGVRVYDSTTGTGNEFLHRVIVFTGHEIESYEDIYLNDEVVTLDGNGNVTSPSRYDGFVTIKKYFGTSTQTADTDLIAATATLTDGKWTTFHRLQGIAYLYVKFKYNQDAFPNGVPSVSAIIKGKKVYDPRTATTAWSENPALCLRDYLTSDYGLNQGANRVDDSLVSIAADICEETVEGEDRYTCNGAFVTSLSPTQIISDLLTSMGGLFWYSQGKWKMKAAAYTIPSLTFTEDDLRSNISLSTRHSRRDNFNTVKGTFRGPDADWQEADYPEITDPAFVSADNGIVNTLDYGLPFTSSPLTAQRIARIALNRNREQLTLRASFGLRAFAVQVGDNIYLTNTRFGWNQKPFEVTSWSFGLTDGFDLQVNMTLRETSSDVFTSVNGAVFESNNTTLPSPFAVPAIGLNVTSEVRIINEHLTNVIFAAIDSTTPFDVERVEVQAKKSSDTNWTVIGTGDLGVFELLDTEDATYDIRARSYSFLGVKSNWITQTGYAVVGLGFPPADVTNLTAEVNGATIHLEWEPVPDLDLSFYRIRHATEEAGATWANATTAVEKVPRPGNSVSVPAKPGTYTIRAYDKTGNASENYTSVVIPEDALEDFTNTTTQTEDPSFSGAKTGCSVTSNELRITSIAGTPPFVATYEFSNYIDTGAARRFRSRIDVKVNRENTTSNLWDDLPGLFDSLPGLFDDFTGLSQFDDNNVVTYIATTTDDPAGTPTWSAWQQFRAGDYYARAAKFKIELFSNTVGITPSISELDAIVQYN